MYDRYSLADNLVKYCKEKRFSVEAFAEAIGKSPRQVNRYRNGQCQNIPLDTLHKMADTLEISIQDLLT